MTVTAMTLRGLRSIEGAVEVLHQLGYAADALPFDATSVGLDGQAVRLRSSTSQTHGFGVLVATASDQPRSLRSVGRRLIDTLHDQPLAIPRDGRRYLTQVLAKYLGASVAALVDVTFATADDKTVAVVSAEPATQPVFVEELQTAEFFIRSGASTRQLKVREPRTSSPSGGPGQRDPGRISHPLAESDSIDGLFTFRSHLGNAHGPPCGAEHNPGRYPSRVLLLLHGTSALSSRGLVASAAWPRRRRPRAEGSGGPGPAWAHGLGEQTPRRRVRRPHHHYRYGERSWKGRGLGVSVMGVCTDGAGTRRSSGRSNSTIGRDGGPTTGKSHRLLIVAVRGGRQPPLRPAFVPFVLPVPAAGPAAAPER